MKSKTYIFIVPILLLIAYFGFNLGANKFLSSLAIDATSDRLFTLSQATKKTIAKTNETIIFDFYFSQQAASENPPIRLYGARVRDLLKSYARQSHGKIIFREHDTAPFSGAEDEAIRANLLPWRDSVGAVSPIYLGLVAHKNNQNSAIIRAFMPEKESSLEYDITRLISNLNNPRNRIIGVISDIDWFFQSGPDGLRPVPVAQIAKSLSTEFEVINLPKDFDVLPPKMDALFIAQSFDLNDFQQYLIDQYVVSGGSILLAQDPASSISYDNKIGRISSINALGRLSLNWGFEQSGEIAADKQNALLIQSKLKDREVFVPQPLYYKVPQTLANGKNLITANLARGINVSTPGALHPTKGNLRFEPLLQTSTEAMLIDKETALRAPTPQEIASIWHQTDENYTIAAAINGPINSVFPNGPPKLPLRSALSTQIYGPQIPLPTHQNLSQRPANIIVISDVDFLSDALFSQAGTVSADNLNFIMNAIDILSGEPDLINLRSRAEVSRKLKAIEDLGKSAQENVLENQTSLEEQLRELQAQLNENEINDVAAGQGNQLRKEIAKIRSDLRRLEGARQSKISQLKNIILGFCAGIVPLLILIIGFYRNRKSRYFAPRA